MKIALSKIKLNPDNPRFIRDDRFEQLVQSIKDFPEMLELRPIVLNADLMALGGNMRTEACKVAGLKDVPYLLADKLTPDQQREFMIKDNIGFGEWDKQKLNDQFKELELIEYGFEENELEFMDINQDDSKEDDFVIPDEIKTDIVLGDLIEIGNHRLLCGDSTDSDQVAKLMDDQKADMVFTDPPYDYKSFGKGGAFAKQNDKFKKDIDNISKFDPIPFLHTIPFVFEKGKWNCYIFCNRALVPKYLNFAEDNKLSFDILCWHKKTFIPNAGMHHYPDTEYIIFLKKSGIFNSGLSADHYYKYYIEDKDKVEGHPTIKPIKIISYKVNLSSNKGGIVVDFYMGSGSTMVACEQLNRKCYGMEIEPKYCQVIIDRMKALNPEIQIKINGNISGTYGTK